MEGALNNSSPVCRTCLSNTRKTQSIFENSMYKILMECASVQVEDGDELPHVICVECLEQLNKSYRFKKTCEKSDEQLRKNIFHSIISSNNDCLQIIADNLNETIIEQEDADNIITSNDVEEEKIIIQSVNYDDKPRRKTNKKKQPVNKINEESNNLCGLCNGFLYDNDESTHIKECHQDGQHVCYHCRKMFADIKLLKRHMRIHSAIERYLCNYCGKGFHGSTDLTIHMRRHTGEKPLTCGICSKAFADPRGLNSHLKTHSGDKPYKCDICGKGFAHSFVLTTHKRTHTAERPYVCSTCGKTFVYAHNLAIHTRVHTGERPYSCKVCAKSFTSSSTLSAHMLTHTGEKRFVCSVCGKKVARSGDLAIHMRTHTGDRPYACKHCPKRYRMSSHLTAHMKTHTGIITEADQTLV